MEQLWSAIEAHSEELEELRMHRAADRRRIADLEQQLRDFGVVCFKAPPPGPSPMRMAPGVPVRPKPPPPELPQEVSD